MYRLVDSKSVFQDVNRLLATCAAFLLIARRSWLCNKVKNFRRHGSMRNAGTARNEMAK